jgi:hypothetical protein
VNGYRIKVTVHLGIENVLCLSGDLLHFADNADLSKVRAVLMKLTTKGEWREVDQCLGLLKKNIALIC